ncbi:hypothetical protein C5B91_09390 [Haloferax sp. Atlit-10N]|uniref:Cell surface glycoprotein n=1 Tax=Haloferax prahovense (strain DSM 18310 / JCM 13924 / TL6) TaxID=1227461 RepID=M0G574_HALPT|nr:MULTISPECIES: hypothetical protein [Haloferax]ELZ65954.1 hypothetical protein C457_15387 [Haloferax prahovense DSM 18310]RDZ44813.1 hypothetical protein C5B87_11580 [Haloferax sp. Atlit-16N]RDZ59408.1 hypothetical protein C5B91_09390 [Haloferax sp. Atlit-10N]
MHSSRALLLALVLVCSTVAPLTAAQSADYDVDIDDDLDIPDRTISTQWGDQTIEAIGSASEDGTVSVSADGPSGDSYSIRVVDSQQRLRDNQYVDGGGSASASFSLDRYDPGTYAIALTNGTDTVYAVEPFVINGFDVEQTAADRVEADDELLVEVNLSKVSNDVESPPAGVEVVLGNESTSVRTTATQQTGLNYTARVDVGSLSTGDYRLYSAAQTGDEVFGEPELVAVSGTQSVSVVEEGSLQDSDSTDESDDTTTEEPTETDTTTETNESTTSNTTAGSSGGSSAETTDSPTPTGDADDADDGNDADEADQSSSTTEPTGSTGTESSTQTATPTTSRQSATDTTTETAAPLWGPVGIALVCVVGLVGVSLLRRRS